MIYNTFTLANGIRIIHAPNQSAVAYCGFAIDAGTRDEADNEQGMAHFVEHLIFKGTQKRHAWHILNRMEHVGGDLNEKNDAEYSFYKDYPSLRLDVDMPEVTSEDIVMFGSFYAITPQLRDKVKELLDKAKEAGAIIYYDVNFRSTHAHEAIKLMPTILENFEYADIVRGSNEDFGYMFGMTDADKVYQHKVGFYCPRFICTNGGEGLCLRTKTIKKDYPVAPLQTVSTIGAGDNFNAGLVFGLLKNRIRKADLDELTEADWDKIIASGMSFSREVCASFDNYISKEFAAKL